jgi:hypothetical protein
MKVRSKVAVGLVEERREHESMRGMAGKMSKMSGAGRGRSQAPPVK